VLTEKQFDVKCWQVVPHESFKWQIGRKIQAGDMVQVINPLSAEYHRTGTVCNVTAAYVEVTDATNTKVSHVSEFHRHITDTFV
jgi:hypothetical protein